MDNRNGSKSRGAEDPEHQRIAELLLRLNPGIKLNGHNALLSRSSATASITPPNTPVAATRGITPFSTVADIPTKIIAQKSSKFSAVDSLKIITNGEPVHNDPEVIANSAVDELDKALQELYNAGLDSAEKASPYSAGVNSGTAVSGGEEIPNISRVNEAESSNNSTLDEHDGGNSNTQNTNSEDNKTEHELIRDYTSRLCRVSSIRNQASSTSEKAYATCSNGPTPLTSESRLAACATEAQRVGGDSDEEHLLISSYTTTLSSNRSPSSLLMSPSVRRVRGGSGRTDEEHSLINTYTSSLANQTSAAGTARTSRRSSFELDIDSVEEFYETQTQVFLQLQRKNLELRRKIAELKSSPAASQSGRSDSPASPLASGQWNHSEYYRYTSQGEEQVSPRTEGSQNSPVFLQGAGGEEAMNGDSNERTLDRNARLQMLKNRREQLTQQLKQLLTDDNSLLQVSSSQNPALRVN